MTNLLAAIGANIRKRRRALDITQADMANQIGCVQSMVTHLEKGRRDITVTRLVAIAELFECSVEDLLKRNES